MIRYDAPLYRGDKMTSNETRANRHYTTRYHKFFTTQESETEQYIKKAPKGYTKEWTVTEPLHLIDIMDRETRRELEHLIEHPAFLDTAFPVRHNKVYRYSEDDTAQIDARLLGELCQIQTDDGTPIDGYYMAKQRLNAANQNRAPGIIGFHSEVGLCSSAFRKLLLTRTTLSSKASNVKNERKTKKHNLQNKPSSPAKVVKGRKLFNNNNNNNNINNAKNIRNNNTKKNRNYKNLAALELTNLM